MKLRKFYKYVFENSKGLRETQGYYSKNFLSIRGELNTVLKNAHKEGKAFRIKSSAILSQKPGM